MKFTIFWFKQNSLKDDLKKGPGTFIGSEFDLDKYISQSQGNKASIETTRRNHGTGNVETYQAVMDPTAECHVEFQVVSKYSLMFRT